VIDRLTIGSANFGLEYGVSNKRKLNKEEALNILGLAHDKGIQGVDTAKTYGDAEKIIGEYFERNGKVFKVISKLPKKEYASTKDVENEILGSLRNMNISFIDCMLMHSYETFEAYGRTVVPVLESLHRDKVLGYYGISAYHPEEVKNIVREIKGNLAIEFPLNLFDQRFLKDNFIQRLKDDGNLLYARSVFLQGLFFLDERMLKGKFEKVRNKVRRIKDMSEEYHIKPEYMALLFVVTNPWIDGVVFGIDSKEHLASNIYCLSEENLNAFELLKNQLSDFEICDEDIILPYRWRMN
jgi:aryl-alcohol dehydrogenase-like predicted oxidoreductase